VQVVRPGAVPSTTGQRFPVEHEERGRTTSGGPRHGAEERDMANTAKQGQLVLDLPIDARVGYGGKALCGVVGITYRQLDYWARTGLVTPSIRSAKGSGSQRLYSFEDIVRLRVVKRLLDAGVNLERIRAALEELARQGRTLSEVTLASDGRTVYAIDDDRQLLDLLQRGQAVFAIAVEPLIEELRGEVSVLEAAPAAASEATDTVRTLFDEAHAV
jgi:DNA-binding transcriptional MerR regulator